jgi:hypothetical protein
LPWEHFAELVEAIEHTHWEHYSRLAELVLSPA